MRVSNNMMYSGFLSSYNKSLDMMNQVQQQLSDGKIVHRASDDPVRAFRSLRFDVDLTMNTQYTQNSKDATEWLNSSDSALSDFSSVLISAKETTIQAVSANPTVSMQALGSKIDGMINQLVTTANTQIGERYVFAGQKDQVPGGPFERKSLTVGGVTKDYVVYKGDLNKISMPIQSGPADPKKDSVNVTGADVFGPLNAVTDDGGTAYQIAGVFSDLLDVKNQLTAGTPTQSNSLGGAASVSGLYTGAARQSFQVQITGVNAMGQVSGANYSTDSGATWAAVSSITTGTPSSIVPVAGSGITLDIGTSANTTVGDKYSFTVDPGAGSVTDTTWLSNTGLANIDKGHSQILLAQSQIGARQASYEMAQNMMLQDNTTISDNQSANDDLDIAKATIDFKNDQNVYNAALSVGAKIMPTSLVDYLK